MAHWAQCALSFLFQFQDIGIVKGFSNQSMFVASLLDFDIVERLLKEYLFIGAKINIQVQRFFQSIFPSSSPSGSFRTFLHENRSLNQPRNEFFSKIHPKTQVRHFFIF
jgi:hypothetical protein